MTIYRGYEITKAADGTFSWVNEKDEQRAGYTSEEAAMNDIDEHKRALRMAGA